MNEKYIIGTTVLTMYEPFRAVIRENSWLHRGQKPPD